MGLSLKAFRHGAISFWEMRECLLSEISLSLWKNLTWLEVERSQGFLLKKRSDPILCENVGFCKKPIIQSVSFQNRSLNHTHLNPNSQQKSGCMEGTGLFTLFKATAQDYPPENSYISITEKEEKRTSSKLPFKGVAYILDKKILL